MRKVAIAMAVFWGSNVAAAAEGPVMLEQPGTLEAIRNSDPARYDQLIAIVSTAEKVGCGATLPSELSARFGVAAAKCVGYALMTEPQKGRLTFILDGKQYTALVRQGGRGHAD